MTFKIISHSYMEKYIKALFYIDNLVSWSHPQTFKMYLEELRETKTEMLSNLSVSPTSIRIVTQIIPIVTVSRTLKQCLVGLATSSLTILSQLKSVTTESIITSNTELFEKKNADYGNSFVDFELIGIIVRLNDKINRILNLGEVGPETIQVDEKVEDTINDLYNYCIIGLMYS